MDRIERAGPRKAELVVPCTDLDVTVEFLVERVGLRLDSIFPADDPREARVSGYGLALLLQRDTGAPAPFTLRLSCADPGALGASEWSGPDGIRVIAVADGPAPPAALVPSFVHTRVALGATWQPGRAGMLYRDLVPDRLGGGMIASHIRIPDGGPVPDYVHFHDVRFQMIYCRAGWVRVVYEDQGPPFVLHPGDCVLQPPRIRHRVLECSDGLEVVEVGAPALHPTYVEHELELPTSELRPQREFRGQVFVRHVARDAEWTGGARPGFDVRDLGLGAATRGLGGGRVLRRAGDLDPAPMSHTGELCMFFVLAGAARLARPAQGAEHDLVRDDCVVLPPREPWAFASTSADFEALEVSLPAELPIG